MALHNDDLLVVQKHDGANEIRKATIAQLGEHFQASNTVAYKGQRNFTVVDPADSSVTDPSKGEPTDKNVGDLYINSAATSGTWAWSANSGGITDVEPGDRALWNGTNWDIIQSGTGDVGVESITGALPIEIENGNSSTPNVTIRAATTTLSGYVNRLATAADVDADSGTGDTAAVVTADLLKTTNIAVQGALAGGLGGIVGVDPIVTSTTDDGGTTTAPSIKIKDAASGQKGAIAIQPIGAAPVTDTDVAATPGYVDAHYVPSNFAALADA